MKIRFNLLPQKQKKHLKTQKTFRIAMEQEIHIIIILLFLVLGLFAMFVVLKTETHTMNEVVEKVTQDNQYKEIAGMRKKFATIHKKMKRVDALNKNHIYWSQLFTMLSETIPANIAVESLTTNNDTVTIHAIALTRDDVVLMKEKFSNVKKEEAICFSEIVVPESDLTVPVDVPFTMTLKVNPTCLK